MKRRNKKIIFFTLGIFAMSFIFVRIRNQSKVVQIATEQELQAQQEFKGYFW